MLERPKGRLQARCRWPDLADCVEKLGGSAPGVIQGVDLENIYLSLSTQTDNRDGFLVDQTQKFLRVDPAALLLRADCEFFNKIGRKRQVRSRLNNAVK